MAAALVQPSGSIVGVFSTELAAHSAIARRWPGPSDFVTVVRGGAFTWVVWVEHEDGAEVTA